MRDVTKRSRRCDDVANNVVDRPLRLFRLGPPGEARPSLTTKFRPVHPGLAQNRAETQHKRSDSEPNSDDSADETREAKTRD